MPSQLHEMLVLLFDSSPQLTSKLLREALHVDPPQYARTRVGSADLSEVDPVQYQADVVVILEDEASAPVLGVVVEVQLARDSDKRFVWPVYVTNLRARLRCPVDLLVITIDEPVARWAAKPIVLGTSNRFVPLVLGPASVPEVTDPARARADPELAVLSAMSHGQSADACKRRRSRWLLWQPAPRSTSGDVTCILIWYYTR